MLKHVGRKNHQDMARGGTSSQSLLSFCSTSYSSIEAEARWATFVAKHNIAFLASDHATKLFHNMFPDSEIAKKFSCGRTKTTAIIKEALAPHFLKKATNCMSYPFSLMMDESNDKNNKSCIILVRVFDSDLRDVATRFLDMPVVNIGNARNLFDALKSSLNNNGLDFSKTMAFMSDTTNVLKGNRSGVQKLIKNEHPILYDVGCICHLADLVVKAGMQTLPLNIDELFVDIFYFFHHSSKRKQLYADLWCSLFTTEPEVILKHCTTRWLSLLRCVNRYISQLEGLKSFFRSSDEGSSKVAHILKRLENPMLKPLLFFLQYILPSMDKFNRVFQKSTENTTCELYTEICRLTRLYAASLLKPETILSVGNNLHQLCLDRQGQLDNENLGIGTETWKVLAELEEVHDMRPFFNAVREFYVTSIQKMKQKFPFHDSLLKDLGVLQPEKTASYSVSTVLGLAKRFPQLGLSEAASLDQLREEFMDFQLSPANLPSPSVYKAADCTERPRVGSFWSAVERIRTLDGKSRFSKLCMLMYGLLSIPCSNADSERGFSMLRKIHTDQRSNLDQSTVIALMTIKYNCDDCCHDMTIDKELLSQCKKATVKSLSSNK